MTQPMMPGHHNLCLVCLDDIPDGAVEVGDTIHIVDCYTCQLECDLDTCQVFLEPEPTS